MKWLLMAAMTAVAAAPAYACNSEMLAIESWEAVANDGNPMIPVSLSATVRYDGAKPYRMIHAGVMFDDALGGSLGQVNLDRDLETAPGDEIVADGYVDADERMLTVNREDVVARTCVWSIVYADGTVERFD